MEGIDKETRTSVKNEQCGRRTYKLFTKFFDFGKEATRKIEKHGSTGRDERTALKERNGSDGDKRKRRNGGDEIRASCKVKILNVGVARHCR